MRWTRRRVARVHRVGLVQTLVEALSVYIMSTHCAYGFIFSLRK